MSSTNVSVIVPVYNVAPYLPDCINSLLAQSLSSIQIILVNDGSKDNSGEICDEYAAKDSRIEVFHKKNEGVTKARALGIEKATGKWIMFVDGDDTLPFDALNRLYNKAIENSCDIIQGCWYNFYNTHKRRGYLLRNGKMTGGEFIRQLLDGGAPVGILGKMYRRGLFDDNVMNIPSEITNNEDLLMNINIAKKADNVYFDARGFIYNYNIRGGTASSRHLSLEKWDLLFGELKKALSHNFESDYNKYVIYMMTRLQSKDSQIDFTHSEFFNLCRIDLYNRGAFSRLGASIRYLINPSLQNYNIVKFHIFISKLKRPFKCLIHNSF